MHAENLNDPDVIEATVEALTEASPFEVVTRAQVVVTAVRLGRAAVTDAPKLTRRGVRLLGQLAQVAVGASNVAPEKSDRRFADPTWESNPAYKRVKQGYLTVGRSVHELVEELALDDNARLKARFLANLAVDAAAPTNTLLGNPAALKEARRTRGRSLVDGLRHAAHDVRHHGAMPSMVDTRPFKIGETVAATPGAVVFRNELLEVLQYNPTTPKVRSRAVLVVPPQINKYYILDLAPGRSFFESAVAGGQRVFAVSWRNPGPAQRNWDLDTYVAAIDEAIDAVLEITKQKSLNLLGLCAGGMTSAAMLGRRATAHDARVNALTLLVAVLDWSVPSTVGTMLSAPGMTTSVQRSRSAGVLRGDDLAKLFAWMRPNDLVWNYWVNNYLMGKNPPAFDVLSWNVDSTNLPAGLHADFLSIAGENTLARAGELNLHGRPVDLSHITCDAYIVGGLTDHITPWEACHRTTTLLGGSTEFVLCASGHVQTLVCPPDNPKARYFIHPDGPNAAAQSANEWLDGAQSTTGSWWEHWLAWSNARSGRLVAAPRQLGSADHPPLGPAPGTYVHGSSR